MTALWRWVLLKLVRSPPAWALWGSFLGCALLAMSLGPLPSASAPLVAALAWVYPVGLCGVCMGLVVLSDAGPFLARLDPGTRFLGELGGLLGASTYLQLSILAATLLSGAAPADLGPACAAILTLDLQLASVALLFLLPALSTALRTSLFLAAVVVVPALCARDARLAPLAAFFDAGAALRLPLRDGSIPALTAGASMALAGYLLRTGSQRAPTA